ncbi:PstS family phosphate ABC transporter substrate-binding protein [Streptomyces sp. 6N223]|uniref:PstS family phosphate ABC transporter substrate-binding protein n=1 Tax=Streptomyces sp. 6N223 TaxID=3457412 RepID=UPI003FD3F4BD
MDIIPWEITLAILGVVVPIIAALWEFTLLGFKRLGYRVQMDTEATQALPGLDHPSLVLLRIENNGVANVKAEDYQFIPNSSDSRRGIRVLFPHRVVQRWEVTVVDPDDVALIPDIHDNIRVDGNHIDLPQVPLVRGQAYKVLVVLGRDPAAPAGEPDRKVHVQGRIMGGFWGGHVRETKSRSTDRSWWSPDLSVRSAFLICFLALVVVAQYLVSRDDPAPLDCAATGSGITVVGSTAFRPVLEAAAASYEGTCPGTSVEIRAEGSLDGLDRLDREERTDMVAFSDGEKPPGLPHLVERPIAFSLFTPVLNPRIGIEDLSVEEIRQVYAGEVATWSEVGVDGAAGDLPVVLVSRLANSGTRQVFEDRVLGGQGLQRNSRDCRTLLPGTAEGEVVHCEVSETDAVLDTVGEIDGAIGYAELGSALEAEERGEVDLLRIDGNRAELRAADYEAYPFWETEYAYTYREPGADSLVAGFLRYLTDEVGKDIIRRHGHRPCAELQNPVLCQPWAGAGAGAS